MKHLELSQSIETEHSYLPERRLADALDALYGDILTPQGRIADDVVNQIEAHRGSFEEFIDRTVGIKTDDIVFTTLEEGVEPTEGLLQPTRPEFITGTLADLICIDADELPRWNRQYGRPIGDIPGLRIKLPTDNASEAPKEYFVPLFSISSVATTEPA